MVMLTILLCYLFLCLLFMTNFVLTCIVYSVQEELTILYFKY